MVKSDPGKAMLCIDVGIFTVSFNIGKVLCINSSVLQNNHASKPQTVSFLWSIN